MFECRYRPIRRYDDTLISYAARVGVSRHSMCIIGFGLNKSTCKEMQRNSISIAGGATVICLSIYLYVRQTITPLGMEQLERSAGFIVLCT